MYYGLLKEPDLNIPLEEEEDGGEGEGGDPGNKSKVLLKLKLIYFYHTVSECLQ